MARATCGSFCGAGAGDGVSGCGVCGGVASCSGMTAIAEGFSGCGVGVAKATGGDVGGWAGCSATTGDVAGAAEVSGFGGSGVGDWARSKTGGVSNGSLSSSGGAGLVRRGVGSGASGSVIRAGGRMGSGESAGSYFVVLSAWGGRPRSLRRSFVSFGVDPAGAFDRRAFPAGSKDISGSGVSKSTFCISANKAALEAFFFLPT